MVFMCVSTLEAFKCSQDSLVSAGHSHTLCQTLLSGGVRSVAELRQDSLLVRDGAIFYSHMAKNNDPKMIKV